MKQTLQQFGATIKAKYPQYKDLPDEELGQKMLTKYPQYSDMVDTGASQQSAQTGSSIPGTFAANPIGNPALEAAKTVANIPGSGVNFLVKGVGGTLNPINTAKTIGKVTESGYGLLQDLKAQHIGDVNDYNSIKSLQDAIAKKKAAGQDSSHLEDSLNKIVTSIKKQKNGQDEQLNTIKDTNGAAYNSLVPSFIQHLISGNTEQAAKAIIEDPVGQFAPLLLMGKQAAENAGVGEQFNKTVSAIASPVTKPLDYVGGKLTDMGNYGLSKVSGLEPSTVESIKANPNEFSSSAMVENNRQSTANTVGEAINQRIQDLSATGQEYQAIRQNGGTAEINNLTSENVTKLNDSLKINLDTSKPVVPQILAKYGIGMDSSGNIIHDINSVPLSQGDINALQGFVDKYAKDASGEFRTSYTANGLLNTRQALDGLINYDSPTKGVADKIVGDLRTTYDTLGKEQVAGLSELDAKYAPEAKLLSKIRKDYIDPSTGGLKDGAANKIANLTGEGKQQILSRLEKIQPGITEDINIVKAIEDIKRASGNKVGTYTRAILEGGGGAGVGFAVAGVPGAIVSAVVTALLTNPSIATELIRRYSLTTEQMSSIVKGMKTQLSGKGISKISTAGVNSSSKNQNK